ncbi:MAG: hypothetical protein DME13_15195 [Candidatus Rokuibacteriota bacterium]|nr:MAG: hypothetical protein DME13_15195 [Candidatus Rokubacteria bacterium]
MGRARDAQLRRAEGRPRLRRPPRACRSRLRPRDDRRAHDRGDGDRGRAARRHARARSAPVGLLPRAGVPDQLLAGRRRRRRRARRARRRRRGLHAETPPAIGVTDLVLLDEARDGVACLTLNRPDALNALNRPLADALEHALGRVAGLDDARVLLVAGRGRAFCAGNDITEMGEVTGPEAEALARRWAAIMERFAALPQVTIAVVDGHALGGGLMLAVAQDLRIASDRARFGLPEVTLGFNPAYGIARLLDVLGGGHGRDLLLTGRTLHATEALRIGLVNRVVAAPTLTETAAMWAAEIAKSPREGLAATKQIVAAIRGGRPGGDPAAYGAALRTGAAARERIRAFVERKRRSR